MELTTVKELFSDREKYLGKEVHFSFRSEEHTSELQSPS